MPYQVIIVGTDGSSRAAVAVHQALELAKLSGATVHVVNAMHTAVSGAFTDPHSAQLVVNEMRDHAEAIREQVHADAERQGVAVEFHSPIGDPADVLIDLAKDLHADLVVVGNRGMSGMKRFVLGNVPNRVSHRCPCGVLIVNTELGAEVSAADR